MVTQSSTIQQAIDEHLQSETSGDTVKENGQVNYGLVPRTVITLNNLSGSFKLPKGVRLVLRNCDGAKCTSAEGNNEISFCEGSGAEVQDFKSGVLRFEKCSDIQKIVASQGVHITASGVTIQECDITDSYTMFDNCQVQQAKFTRGETKSFKNQYQQFTVEGGSIYSQDDRYQQWQGTGDIRAHIVKTTMNGQFAQEKGSLIIQDCDWSGSDVQLTSTNVASRNSQFKSLYIGGDEVEQSDPGGSDSKTEQKAGTASLLNIILQDDLEIENSSVNIQGLASQGKITLTSSALNAIGIKADEIKSTESQVIMQNSQFDGEASFEDGDLRAKECKFSDKFSLSKGSLQSDQCTFEDKVTVDDGTIDSDNDEWKDQGNLTKLTGPSIIRYLKASDDITITGDQASSLLMEHIQISGDVDLSITNFALVTLNDIGSGS